MPAVYKRVFASLSRNKLSIVYRDCVQLCNGLFKFFFVIVQSAPFCIFHIDFLHSIAKQIFFHCSYIYQNTILYYYFPKAKSVPIK